MSTFAAVQPLAQVAEPSADGRRQVVDYDLHGIVGVRLIGARPGDAAAVARQLGPLRGRLSGEPDIVIRFVDRLAHSSLVRFLGLNDYGYTEEGFFVLRGRRKSAVMVRLPFEQIGGRCEIVCESGLSAVPCLIPVVNLTALRHGVIPLHASAFEYAGQGVLVTGWSKGGKTETLLAFAAEGARYIGDEWVFLSGDGERMAGLPERIRVWDWHLAYLPQLRRRVSREARAKLWAIRALRAARSAFPERSQFLPVKLLNAALPAALRQAYVDIAPETLFGSCGPAEGRVDRVIFATSHAEARITVEKADPAAVAERMVFSLRYERQELMAAYAAFRFAFPDRDNPFLESVEGLQRRMLSRALAGKTTFAVGHPYPVALPDLFRAVRACLEFRGRFETAPTDCTKPPSGGWF